jgi:alcohol dehydrogenase
MQRLEFIKKNRLEWRDVPTPMISEVNQAIVRPLAVSRCDLDLPMFRGETLFRPPFPIGHEFIGEILHVSEDLYNSYSMGDRVVVPFQISCGTCPICKSQNSQSCDTVPPGSNYGIGKGGKDFGGALSDSILVPYAREMLVPISKDLDPVGLASLSDNIVEAWKLVGQHLEKDPNQSVLIVGGFAGSIGLYSALLAKSMSKSQILYIDSRTTYLALAESWGIPVEQFSEFPRSHSKKFDIIADANGTKEGWLFGLRSASINGIFGTAAIFWTQDLPIPYLDLYNSGIQINIGRVRSREWIPKILNLVIQKIYNPGLVVTRKVSWKEAPEALLEEEPKLVVVADF